MSGTFLILFAVVVIGLLVVAAIFWLRHQVAMLQQRAQERSQELTQASLSQMKQNHEEALRLLAERMAKEQIVGVSQLEQRKQAVEGAVSRLEEQLKRYESLVKGFEADRERKFGSLEGELKRAMEETVKLRQTTNSLVSVLGNVKIRGQWGQKMAEDILRLCGLQPGIQYETEKQVGSGRPDYTFMLPGGQYLFMDVKFPFENYLRFTRSEQQEEQAHAREGFIRDVRTHLRDMEKRGYSSASDQALDYMLIFIPNEQVYGLVNEWMPDLFDECLKKRMILCGPWTLYAVLQVIHQAWKNYRYGEAVHEIVRIIDGFMQDYRLFRERFQEVGARLEKTQKAYEDVANTSHRRLEQRIQKIEECRKGEQIAEVVSPLQTIGAIPVTAEDA